MANPCASYPGWVSPNTLTDVTVEAALNLTLAVYRYSLELDVLVLISRQNDDGTLGAEYTVLNQTLTWDDSVSDEFLSSTDLPNPVWLPNGGYDNCGAKTVVYFPLRLRPAWLEQRDSAIFWMTSAYGVNATHGGSDLNARRSDFFVIRQSNPVAPMPSSSLITASTRPTASTHSTTSSPTSTSTTTDSNSSAQQFTGPGPVGVGAGVGIGIAATILISVLVAVLWWLRRRRSGRQPASSIAPAAVDTERPGLDSTQFQKSELEAQALDRPGELEGHVISEMEDKGIEHGRGRSMTYELDAGQNNPLPPVQAQDLGRRRSSENERQ